jgi:hypothetical protein
MFRLSNSSGKTRRGTSVFGIQRTALDERALTLGRASGNAYSSVQKVLDPVPILVGRGLQGDAAMASPATAVPTVRPRRAIRTSVAWIAYWLVSAVVLFEVVGRFVFPFYADDRTFFPQLASKVMMSNVVLKHENTDTRYDFRTPPGAVIKAANRYFSYTARINSLGFRGTEPVPKRAEEYRLMLVGDSATFGMGLCDEDTISQQVERIAKEKRGANATVTAYNYGHLGFNLVQELLILRDYFENVEPDHVLLILSVYTDNLSDAVSGLDADGNFAYSEPAAEDLAREIRGRYGVFNLSLLFRMFEFKYLSTRTYYSLSSRPEVIGKSFAWLDSFAKFCRSRAVPFTVVNVYSPDAVKGGLHEFWNGSRKVHAMFTDHCQQHQIEVIDMLRFMNSYSDWKRYYFGEGHLTPSGARKIAEVIFDEAVSERLGN